MTIPPERPTWDLGGEPRPASFPACQIDLDAAFAAALAEDPGYERMGDVTDVTHAAIGYAAECMRDALAELAFRARDLGPDVALEGSTGWRASWLPGPRKSIIDLMLVHPSEPGAWHVSVRFDPSMTDAAAARLADLERQRNDELKASGLSDREIFLARIFPKGDQGPTVAAIKALEKDPASWQPAKRGDSLELTAGTALDLGCAGWNGVGPGGNPSGVEDPAKASEFLPVRVYPQTWWPGMELHMRSLSRYDREKGMLSPRSDRSGGAPHIVLELLSDLVRSNGLEPLVAPRAAETAQMPWVCFGDERHLLLQEAGHAAVHAAGGVFDASVTARIRDFSAGIAASDVSRHVNEWRALVPKMIGKGYTGWQSAFECNDGRDIAWAGEAGSCRSLHVETQHGIFRLDMHQSPEGDLAAVTAVRERRDRDHVVGRFVATPGGLRPSYGETAAGEPAIAWTIRNVYDMNGIILSLSSVACVFAEEFGCNRDDEEPAP
ncbi:hypothetical protein LAZ40_06685 [Cereibacter sphaeroides]|uniref:hypothetical protein n=1 Tax=Cereibacter sphaeroides TaxID=1063 RepID=UPI001F3D876D|nr:hypothetical protein [Cereibacter sphaeroides]MCE6958732.1 hypothetical protein [Cereibacter sphaeroides]MCE6973394.1 hypothetical protein [Cereibacter sphaeroides]